jgi:hypothetical protein
VQQPLWVLVAKAPKPAPLVPVLVLARGEAISLRRQLALGLP